jgi:transcriptional regulator with XRE-family HTH domain
VRLRCKIPQDELAFRCGFDRTYIRMLERGIRSPTLRTIVTLCRELDVRLSVLMHGVERKLHREEGPKRAGPARTALPVFDRFLLLLLAQIPLANSERRWGVARIICNAAGTVIS